ncbi:MAG: hypothetical protein H0T53_15430 [Herpetosiphonaceae bacterium]|nr:hypothetical protein [Herpetosiphonaceae bacterium]
MLSGVRWRWAIGIGLLLAVFSTLAAAAPQVDSTIYLPLVLRSPVVQTSTNLPVFSATHIGGSGSDAASAVDVDLSGNVIWAGLLVGANPVIDGVAPVTLLGGGVGAIVRFDSSGTSVLSVTRIGTNVRDLEIGGAGPMVVCGDFGVAVLNASASSVLWSATPGAVRRCAIGSDGTTAASVGAQIYAYAPSGQPLGSWSSGGATGDPDALDLAVASASQAVIVTGYKQKTNDLQVAFLSAWSYSGAPRWTSYDFSASAVNGANISADTRGRRVAIGRDGKLYFAGSINGGTGASIFSRDPKNLTLTLGGDRSVSTDPYNTSTNTGSVSIIWYGRYNPADGSLEKGQSALTRKDDGKGNSIGIKTIAADEAGRIYLGGDAYYQIHNRAARQVAGTTVGPYASGEAYLLVVSADLRERHIWTGFAGPAVSAGGSPVVGVAVRKGIAAIAITLNNGRLITTANALQPSPGPLADGYLAVWRQ